MAIDFAKILWEKYGVKYGKKWVDYEPWPRQWKIRGVINGNKIKPIYCSINIKDDEVWVKIEEGGVTGYESARLQSLWYRQYDWCACAGGMGWSRLDIKWKDLSPMLREMREHVNYLRSIDGKATYVSK